MNSDQSGTAVIEVIVDLPNSEAMDALMVQITDLTNGSGVVAGNWKAPICECCSSCKRRWPDDHRCPACPLSADEEVRRG